MKWALTQPTNEVHYWKMYQGELPTEMKYNGRAQSFRLTAGEKRLFFVERTGFLQNKYLVKTEYSQLVGEVHPGKALQSGFLLIGNNKFHYTVKDKLLEVTSKKDKFQVTIELDDLDKVEPSELCGLLFSTVKVITKETVQKPSLELV